jgi:hypothetical protein
VLLRVHERTVREQRLAVLNADRGCGLDRLQLLAANDLRQLPDREELLNDRLLLVGRQPLELFAPSGRVDLEQVLHLVLLRGMSLSPRRTYTAKGDNPARAIFAIALLSLVQFIDILDWSILNIALPSIKNDLGQPEKPP